MLTGVVLAGGNSRRMGQDKAWVMVNDRPLVQYAIESIQDFCRDMLISGDRRKYSRLGFTVVEDQLEGIGPLGGIAAVFRYSGPGKYLITACDIPNPDAVLLIEMVNYTKEFDVVMLAEPGNNIQPLPLIIDQKTLTILENCITNGNFRFQSFLQSCMDNRNIRCKVLEIESRPLNINHPKDLDRL